MNEIKRMGMNHGAVDAWQFRALDALSFFAQANQGHADRRDTI